MHHVNGSYQSVLDDFINDEADEVPEDYESEHAPEDGEMEIDPDDLDLEYLDE